MFLKKIHIENYRNFYETDIELEEGLNVIIGANNSGKTNILKVISFLQNTPSFTIYDFNMNNLHKNLENYKINPPVIKIKYEIEHIIDFNKEDSAFEKLEKFLQYNENGGINEEGNKATLSAIVELRFELDPKFLDEYKKSMDGITDLNNFCKELNNFISEYKSEYFNFENEMQIADTYATKIFEIENIIAERHTDEIEDVSKPYVKNKIEEIEKTEKTEKTEESEESEVINCDVLTRQINNDIQKHFEKVVDDINSEIDIGQDSMGITNGRNKFVSSFEFDGDFLRYFHYEIKDVDLGYSLPAKQNGLGYSNLIYMRNKIKQKKDNDYNILLIEEPEAHLHPNMQYKLMKYIEELKKDDKRNIQNQIVITTHSPNISASTKFSNMILFNYAKKDDEAKNVTTIRFGNNFQYEKVKDVLALTKEVGEDDAKFNKVIKETKTNLMHYQNHLEKFLDITRCDLLFSSKVILTEGIAEKLTMPLWSKLLGIDITTEHITVIEVGGINFNNFFPVFLGQPKRVACFRDCDFKYIITNDDKKEELNNLDNYSTFVNEQIQKFISREFRKQDCLRMFTQEKNGSTFETELFIENFDNDKNYQYLMRIANLPDCLNNFVSNKTIQKFHNDIESINNIKTKEKVKRILDLFWNKYETEQNNDKKKIIEKIFFTYLFYSYIKENKGEFALILASDDNIKVEPAIEAQKKDTDIYLKVPTYIEEGLKWLLK